MDIILYIFISLCVITFTYLIKSKNVKVDKRIDIITNETIELEKKRLETVEFDIELRQYRMSREIN